MPVSIRKLAVVTAAGIVLLQMEPRGLAQRPAAPADTQLEGVLEVIVEDHADRTTVLHFLDTDTGRVRIREQAGQSSLKDLVSGTRVRVRGRRAADGAFELDLRRADRGAEGESVTAISLASPNTFGPQRTAVILVNFQDNQSAPYGWAHAHNVTFESVSAFFAENSYGQTSLYGDVFGWFTLPMSANGCDTSQIAALADQAVTGTGVNLNGYSRRIYAFPNIGCSFWGRGTVGGNPSRSWINGTYSLKVVAHELGHNFGDWHSNSAPCDTGGCSHVEYGDDRDIMGLHGAGHLHAYQKERLGWLNYGISPTIQTVTTSGTYWVGSLTTMGTGPKALKVLKSTAQSGNVYYYVESRSQTGFDAGFSGGVILHTGNELQGNSAIQVDLDPVTPAFDPVLDPGQTFTDAAARFTARTISSDMTGAWVEIQIGGGGASPCVTNAPQLSLTPGGTVTATQGSTISYALSIANRDEAGCPSTTFQLGAVVPADWTWSAGELTRTLTPGATGVLTFSVRTASTATGLWQIVADVTRTGTAGPGASISGSVSVVAPTPTPVPVLSADVTATVNAQTQAVLEGRIRNGDAPAPGASMTFIITSPAGHVTTLAATSDSSGRATVKHKLKPKDPRGAYVVTLTATLNGASTSASASFVY